MKKIVVEQVAGRIAVIHPFEGARICTALTMPDGNVVKVDEPVAADMIFRRWPVEGVTVEWAETEDEFVARVAAKDVPADAVSWRIVEEGDIPSDRSFRDAWVLNGAVVVHDIDKARDILKERLRSARAPLLAALDVDYQRADEIGDAVAKADIVKRKQALRDITKSPAIAAARSVADLAQVTVA